MSDNRISEGKPRVLVVDDDESLLLTTSALLEDDFVVATARSGAEALRHLQAARVDVLCTDFSMPGMNGLELLARAARSHPEVSGVLVTGHRDYLSASKTSDGLTYAVLLKPYREEELVERLRRAAQMTKLKRSMASRPTTEKSLKR